MRNSDTGASGAMVAQLRSAVALLASSKAQQVSYLRSLGVLPSVDELGLEYDDIYPSVHSLRIAGCMSLAAEGALDGLSALLSAASEEDPHFWSADSLDGDTWQRVRSLARNALSELE